jgi:mortality factor 4-like protein 1
MFYIDILNYFVYIRSEELLDEVLHGLRTYFNKALGTMLLYRFERHQYADIRRQHPDKDLIDLYGAEHLLRLFGKKHYNKQ